MNSCRYRHLVCLVLAFLLPLIIGIGTAAGKDPKNADPQGINFTVVVYDRTNAIPLELARVGLYRGSTLIHGKVTNAEGRAEFTEITPGKYRMVVRSVGYSPFEDTAVLIDKEHTFDSVTLTETESEVTVSGSREPEISNVEPLASNQVFESQNYHAAPSARMTTLVSDNVLGAVRAPTGEVHIRGQHGEFTYFIDGAPIPLGVFGGLNEVVDPKVIDQATFMTGGFPAEYGGQIAAVVDIQNRVPSGNFHLDASTYGGSYLPNATKADVIQPDHLLNSNGQSLSMSDHIGKFGWFISGSREETDRRIDPPVPTIFHDHGFDYFLYGKADYLLSDKDFLTLNLNYGVTNTLVPFDSIEVGGTYNPPEAEDDQQYTTNSFQTLTYNRALSTESDHESNLMAVVYAREGSLVYTPGDIDEPTIDTVKGSADVISEDRTFTTLGVRTKYDNRLSHSFMYATGFNFSSTMGQANFGPIDSVFGVQYGSIHGPHTIANFNGSDFGAFVESEIHPEEWTQIDLGLRYDQHIAPDVPIQTQFSPRIKWNFLFGETDNAYLYYGRMFMPTNIEGIGQLAQNLGSSGGGTLPERDNFYEAVYTHSFDFGLHSKIAYFKKDASPGLDDETIGSSAIKTPINIENVHTQGLELGLSYNSTSPFSGYLNTSLIHAYGSGPISGGFLSTQSFGTATDLDHDQRLSIVGSLNYQPNDWFANATAIYGSGLTNGNPSGLPYGTSLFDFNQFAHVTPSWIVNASVGHTFHMTGYTMIVSLYVGNIFDNEHLLKGAYFSAASWEEPRNAILKVEWHV